MSDESLRAIREAELAAARTVEDAQAKADEVVSEAHRRAQQLVEEGRQAGTMEAERRFEQAVTSAREEAASITAHDRIARLSAEVAPRLPTLVDAIEDLVLAPPTERES